MRYVCSECGKILDEADVLINPDKYANCIKCYDKTKYFDEEQKEPLMAQVAYDYGAVKNKRHWWDL
jgi:DNA-directed RNA polymerase subunit RPC12/RpoP